jgi:hypothetical protein
MTDRHRDSVYLFGLGSESVVFDFVALPGMIGVTEEVTWLSMPGSPGPVFVGVVPRNPQP